MDYPREDHDEAHELARQQTGFWGRRGAGGIVYARSTGRYLLQLRSDTVLQGGTWGVWGGAVDEGHGPEDCVRLEILQETGYRDRLDLHFIVDFVDVSTGFRYSNYLAVVEEEFTPILNWEGKDFGWFEGGEWPEPLHFGLRYLLGHAPDPAAIASSKAGVVISSAP
nr:NUDIX domain-containing protein [Neorhizobium tomejilense]